MQVGIMEVVEEMWVRRGTSSAERLGNEGGNGWEDVRCCAWEMSMSVRYITTFLKHSTKRSTNKLSQPKVGTKPSALKYT